MVRPNQLHVVECPYCYRAWDILPGKQGDKVNADAARFTHPYTADLAKTCHVYQSMGIPYRITELSYTEGGKLDPCSSLIMQTRDAVKDAVSKQEAALFIGGYCNYAPAIAGGIQSALGTDARIGVIWVDAHSDSEIAEDHAAPTRFVAVPTMVMMGQTLEFYRKTFCGIKKPIPGSRFLMSDIRMLDEEEGTRLENLGATRLDGSAFQNERRWRQEVERLAESVDILYLSVDADILKKEYIPAYEKAVPYGQYIDTVMRNIRIVMETGKVGAFSLFCADFDHEEKGGWRNRLSGVELLDAALMNWKCIPEM